MHVDTIQDEAWLEETGKGVEQLVSPAWTAGGADQEQLYQIAIGEPEDFKRQVIAVDSVRLSRSALSARARRSSRSLLIPLAATVHNPPPRYHILHRAPNRRVQLPSRRSSTHRLPLHYQRQGLPSGLRQGCWEGAVGAWCWNDGRRDQRQGR